MKKIKLNVMDVGRLMESTGTELYLVLHSLKEAATEDSKVKSIDIFNEYEFALEDKKIRRDNVLELTYRYI